ncbi:probable glycerol-3-phosphate acyltransferase 8 [Tanacetum coccineum]
MSLPKPESNTNTFPLLSKCEFSTIKHRSIAADLDGTLLKQSSAFPYYMLVAIEAGSLLRGLILLLSFPIVAFAYILISEALAIKILIYISFAGLKVRDIELASRSVLPRFYASDVRSDSFEVFDRCVKKVVVTANPVVMVDAFVKEYLGGEKVLGTEIEVNMKTKRATGFVKEPGVLVSKWKKVAILREFGDERPDLGIGDRNSDHDFMSVCKACWCDMFCYSLRGLHGAQRQFSHHSITGSPKNPTDLPRRPPSPKAYICNISTSSLPSEVTIWIHPRLTASYFKLPTTKTKLSYTPMACLGIKLVIRGNPLHTPSTWNARKPPRILLYVCNHRTALDPIIIAIALGRKPFCVTYSVSKLSRFLSPIPAIALTRDREADASRIKELLQKGDLVVCPEGTTCREPFLLRFSALFAELSDRIVPVAMNLKQNMFHGTCVRGVKFWDPYFYFMNPRPTYEVTFLDRLPEEMTVKGGGKSAFEVANHVQKVLGAVLGFECTNLTRKDKYQLLGGNDGKVESMYGKK